MDANGTIYIADSANHRIQVLSGSGDFVRQWGSYGTAQNQMSQPYGIDVFGGTVVTLDADLSRVQVFTTEGVFVRSWGHYGANVGEFSTPWALDCDPDGNVYVADTYNSRMQVFTAAGQYLWGWFGVQGHGDSPIGVAIDAGSNAYLNDGDHVNIFRASGLLSGAWSAFDQSIGARGMDIGEDGHVFIADAGNSMVREYLPDGSLVQTFGSYGTGPGQFGTDSPTDVACGPNGLIYVCDRANNRIEVFGPPTSAPVAPTSWGAIKALFAK